MSDPHEKKPHEEKVTEELKSAESKKVESESISDKVSGAVSDLTDKLPNLSELGKKFDLDKILGGIKSMVGADQDSITDVDPSDALGKKIELLSFLLKDLNKSHAKLSKEFEKANELLVSVFKDLEALRNKKQE